MEKLEYIKSISGVCHTPCPYHNEVMVGSAKCEDCIYCKGIIPNGDTPYVNCRFNEFADENKETRPNSFGNRLKVTLTTSNDPNDIGYIDGYVSNHHSEVYAIVYIPQKNAITRISIKDLRIIKEGE